MQLLRSGSQSSLSVSKSIRKKGTWPCNGVDMIIIGGNVAVAFVGSWPFHSQLVSPAVTSLSRDIWTPEIFRPPMQTLKTNPAIQTLETNPANHLQWTLRITDTLVHRLQWSRNQGGQGGHWPPQYFRRGGLAPPIIRLDTKPLCICFLIIPDFLRKSLV